MAEKNGAVRGGNFKEGMVKKGGINQGDPGPRPAMEIPGQGNPPGQPQAPPQRPPSEPPSVENRR